ncbi:heparan-alpha-glucosaminide N-acetyltransferase domain-containing protein [Actinotalea sp.]|uniref:heparan-alpha-glucosaminide N-acetyltransferase domain-containing protein n=1 Tax=Actinotalea sp. TaxID=1872145 RepID=UPI0035613999
MQRIVGVDVARGLAVLGMVAAHVAEVDDPGSGWLIVTHGRSAAMFAVLAGLSIGLMSGGTSPCDVRGARWRVAVRAVLLGVLGLLLMALGTPVVVILPSYALMFLLLLPAMAWSRPTLLVAAGLTLAVGPPLWLAIDASPFDLPLSLLAGRYYPAMIWTAYLAVGLALGRSDLRSRQVRWLLAVGGVALVLVGYGGGLLAQRTVSGTTLLRLVDLEPHANTAPEMVGNLGVVALVLVACLVLAERAPLLVAPFAATGALALTAYTGHLVAIAVLQAGGGYRPSLHLLGIFVVVIVAACWAWRSLWGRGPLERLLHGASTRVATAVAAPTTT